MRGVSANKPPMAASKCRLHITTTKFKKEKKKDMYQILSKSKSFLRGKFMQINSL